MTPPNDHQVDMTMPQDDDLLDADVEALLAGRPVIGHDGLLTTLSILRIDPGPVPPASPALVSMLTAGLTVEPVAAGVLRVRWVAWRRRGAAGLAVTLAALTGAATANALPAPVQSVVAAAVAAVTPFQLPVPDRADGQGQGDMRSPAGGGPDPVLPAAGDPDARSAGGDSPDAGAQRPEGGTDAPARIEPDQDRLTPRAPGRTDSDGTASTPSDMGGHVSDGDTADDVEDADTVDSDADEPDTEAPDADEPDVDAPNADGADADGPDTDVSGAELDDLAPDGEQVEPADGDES